ncbi:hypothetical protein AB0M86_20355 [Streptomyces sp. NPDC051639]|uniref:hypothetical protein n=1 Tax=Streptomyces sp. NPDC051639 TaxID=3155671 RepID=UPI00341F5FFF
MLDASRTARRVTGARRPTARAVLVAVLLALFTTFAVDGPPAGRADRVRGGAASAGLHIPMAATGDRPGTDATEHRPGTDATEHRPGTDTAARTLRTDGPALSTDTDMAGPSHGPDAADHRPGVVPRAHEECAAVCSIRAAGRHQLNGERPTPPSHPVTTADATAVPPAALVRTPPVSEPAPRSPGPAVHDRGRAPPASSGI